MINSDFTVIIIQLEKWEKTNSLNNVKANRIDQGKMHIVRLKS